MSEVTDMLDSNVEDIVSMLPDVTDDGLQELRAAEEAGKTRSSLMSAIDDEVASRADSADEDADDNVGDDGGAASLPVADKDASAPVADTTAADLAQEKADKEAKEAKAAKKAKDKKMEEKKLPVPRKPKKNVGFRAVKQKIRNPYTGDVFNKAGFTDVKTIDSWLDAQMGVGLIVEVKIGED